MFQKWTVLYLILVMTKEGLMNNFLPVLCRPEDNESSKAEKVVRLSFKSAIHEKKKMLFPFHFSLQFVGNTISLEHLG